jgi:hypothetical protein
VLRVAGSCGVPPALNRAELLADHRKLQLAGAGAEAAGQPRDRGGGRAGAVRDRRDDALQQLCVGAAGCRSEHHRGKDVGHPLILLLH